MASYLFFKGVEQIFATVDKTKFHLLFMSKTFTVNTLTKDEIQITVIFIV